MGLNFTEQLTANLIDIKLYYLKENQITSALRHSVSKGVKRQVEWGWLGVERDTSRCYIRILPKQHNIDCKVS